MTTSPSTPSANSIARAAAELLVIFAAGLFIYGWKLGDAPLDRTEPHRALVAHQMVTSGQWFIPRLYGELYLRKPPLIYWIEAGTEKLIGHGDEFVWRLPSAVGSALLAVILAAWSARWFGPFARLPAGIACLALIPLWEQDRGADIDALNTLASVVTAMVVLELRGKRATLNAQRSTSNEEQGPALEVERWKLNVERSPFSNTIWVIAFSLSLAATLLLKGPGGFPPILGALIGPSLLLRDWRWVRRPGIWIGLLVGIAIFASYGIAARMVLHHEGVVADNGGLREAMHRLVIHKLSAIVPAMIAPLTTLLYAVPVSLVIVFAVILVRPSACGFADQTALIREAASGKMIALLGTIGAAFVIWIIAGNDNPRYEYVALPLLAPLVGAVAVAWKNGGLSSVQMNAAWAIMGIFGGLWAVVAIVLTTMIWKHVDYHMGLGVAAALSLLAGTIAVIGWFSARRRVGAVAWVVVIVCLAVPLGERKNLERRRKSARAAAEQLRAIVHGESISTVSENRDMPELFYYAGLPVRTFGERGLSKLAAQPGGQWVVLSQNDKTYPEYSTLTAQIPSAFPRGVTRLRLPADRDVVYVGWYDPPPGVSRVLAAPPPSAGDQSDED